MVAADGGGGAAGHHREGGGGGGGGGGEAEGHHARQGHGDVHGVDVGCGGGEREAGRDAETQGLALAKALNDYFEEEEEEVVAEADASHPTEPDADHVQRELKQNRFLRADVISFVRRYMH